jgi:phage virion morphogenesis protein
MTQITIDITDSQIQSVLTEAANQLTDLTPIMASIGEYMVGRTRERFDNSTAPDGQKWKNPLAQATIDAKRRRQSGGTTRTGRSRARTNANPEDILKDTFLLRDTITYQPTSSSVAIGTPQKYGVHHQYGAPRRNIAARPFLGVNDEDLREIEAIVVDALQVLG